MSILFEKLLLEEDQFDDAVDSTEVEPETATEEGAGSIADDIASSQVDDSTDSGDYVEPTTVTYKVSFTLGKHENWSRIDATSKEEAEQLVRDYVTRKWPDREFEVVEIEEFDESELEESLNESLNENAIGQGEYSDKFHNYFLFLLNEGKEEELPYLASQLIRYCKEEDLKDLWYDRMKKVAQSNGFEKDDSIDESLTDVQPIETGAAVGMASIISDLIKDEYEAIDGYNSAIATAEAEGFGDMINVLSEIQAEENLHIGQLQTLMTMVDPNAHLVDDGQQEGIEQLANPLGGDDVVEESLNEDVTVGRPDYSVDMTDAEYEEFRKVLAKHYGSPAEFFKRLHSYKPDFEIHRVDYEDIDEETITLSSNDISQGTGNVIVYTAMGVDTGKIYMYADF